MQFDKICRICLGGGTLISIFETQEQVGESYISFTDMILACAAVTVIEKDGFPSQICGECHKQLCLAYKFRRLCENSFKTMLGYVANFVKNSEVIDQSMSDVKWEKDEFHIFEPNVVRMKLNERDLKDEQDYIKGEEDLDDDRLSPIPEESDQASSLQIESINTMNKKEGTRKKTKLKDGKKVKLKLKQLDAQISLKKQWPCSLCSKIFKWKHSLFAHEISHIGIKRYFCKICNKNYKNEKEHVKMHKNVNFGKFKCEICEKVFNLKQTLGTHLKTHSSNRKKIVCSVEGCNKTFHKVAGLERHELTHTGQRNFICHLCSKGFFDKYQLGIHIRSHTNERPFPCGQCAKAFITSSARKNHELTHSDSKNYHCAYCDMSFSNSAGRSKHLSVHIKVRRHSCRCCGKTFSRSTHKRAHEMNLHGISDNNIS